MGKPEIVCFDEARTPEEHYAQRLRALLHRQAEERALLQEQVRFAKLRCSGVGQDIALILCPLISDILTASPLHRFS